MIPKAVEQIFDAANGLKSKGWDYTVEASYLEIYNEIIRDLLGSNDENSKHEIKMKNSKSNEIYVTNLLTEKVDNSRQVTKHQFSFTNHVLTDGQSNEFSTCRSAG